MKTIKSLIVILILVTGKCSYSQILWSYHFGSNGVDNVRGLTTDSDNNAYVSGAFAGSYLRFNSDSIVCAGYNDTYLAKFDNNGTKIWAKRFGGNNTSVNSEGTPGHYYDKYSNSLLMTLVFYPSIILGNDTFSANNGNIAFVKLDTTGNVIWAKQLPFSFRGITTDSLGNIYSWGNIAMADSLDTIPLQPGVIMAKFDSTGQVLWAKKMFNVYGTFNDLLKVTPYGIKVFNNEIYITAETQGDTVIINTTNYYPPYSNSGALMKFTNDGNLVWMKTFGPDAFVQNIGIDAFGNCYVPGGFKGTIHFDNDSISSQGVTINDGLYAKYDSSGHFQWVKQLNATAGAGFGKLAMNDDGNANIIARVTGSVTFGTFSITSAGTLQAIDNYVAKYNSSGDCIGVEQLCITPGGGFGYIDKDNSDNVVTAGFFQNSITLGGTTYGNFGGSDIAIAKLAAITGTHGGERKSNQLLIYANPNQGKCNITVPDEFKHDKNLTLSIYAYDGKLIQQKKIEMNNDKIKLNLEAEAKGVYNVSLSNGLKSYSGKIVFE